MSEIFNFEIARRALETTDEMTARGKKPKNCSAKHHKVQLLKEELKDKQRYERDAADDAKDALKDYELVRNDPDNAWHYWHIYDRKAQDWSDAKKERLKTEKKLHDAEQAAWACEGANHANGF